MPKIVLLEDEQALREEVADFLASRGHEVLQAGSLAEFAALGGYGRVAILDVMLPDGSGFDAAPAGGRGPLPGQALSPAGAAGHHRWRCCGVWGARGASAWLDRCVTT
jgi:hypothetical protein